MLARIAASNKKLDTAVLCGALAGAMWTAAKAKTQGLQPTKHCPYCTKRVPGDAEHLLSWCKVIGRGLGRRLIAFYDEGHATSQSPKVGFAERTACMPLDVRNQC